MSSELLEKFESVVNNELDNHIVPIKIEDGIKVGHVKIISDGNLKHIKIKNRIKFEGIFLNAAAITIANMLAYKRNLDRMKYIYEADQEYGKYFIDCQFLKHNYNQAVKDQDLIKQDILWSRILERRDRIESARRAVENLIAF